MVRKILIATVAAATLVTGAGAAAVAASSGAGASGGSPSAQRESEVRHEPEARGRIAEDEREAGEDQVRRSVRRPGRAGCVGEQGERDEHAVVVHPPAGEVPP